MFFCNDYTKTNLKNFKNHLNTVNHHSTGPRHYPITFKFTMLVVKRFVDIVHKRCMGSVDVGDRKTVLKRRRKCYYETSLTVSKEPGGKNFLTEKFVIFSYIGRLNFKRLSVPNYIRKYNKVCTVNMLICVY